MRRTLLFLAAVLVGGLLALACSAADAPEGQPLFNGKDLDGWVAEGRADYKDETGRLRPVWSVQDGLLICTGNGYGFLRYDKKVFSDFALHVEYRMAPGCNSGIGIRTLAFDPKLSQATRPSYYSYEIQLLDDFGKPPNKHSSGSLYRYVAPRVNAVKPALQWNAVDVECVGPHIRIRINGEDVIDVDQRTVPEIKNKPLRGYVCLQNHGGNVEFRNIRIRELKAPAKKPAAAEVAPHE
jgi:hypothetical protein